MTHHTLPHRGPSFPEGSPTYFHFLLFLLFSFIPPLPHRYTRCAGRGTKMGISFSSCSVWMAGRNRDLFHRAGYRSFPFRYFSLLCRTSARERKRGHNSLFFTTGFFTWVYDITNNFIQYLFFLDSLFSIRYPPNTILPTFCIQRSYLRTFFADCALFL